MKRQLRGLILALVIGYYLVCIYHFKQTIQFENEARMRLENNVLMHIAPDYGSWFSPKMRNSSSSWVGSRSDHVLTTNETLQSSFGSVPRPPLQGGLGTLVWSAFGAHLSAIAAFTPAQTNRTKGENEF